MFTPNVKHREGFQNLHSGQQNHCLQFLQYFLGQACKMRVTVSQRKELKHSGTLSLLGCLNRVKVLPDSLSQQLLTPPTELYVE